MKTYRRERHDIVEERKVLPITSLAEFAERYGYYVIQALLIFFLIERFDISQELSASLVGTALAMIYISAIVGGFMAEKWLGYYRAGLVGSALMLIGYFLLASASSKNGLYLGLGLISTSSGLIKSNMAAFIGRFYDRSSFDDSRRDFGFNVFYMGINLGGFLGLVFAASLKDHFGYDIAFYSSLVVNLLMFIMLCSGYKFIDKHMLEIKFTPLIIVKVCLSLIVYISFLFYVFKYPEVSDYSVLASAILSFAILFISIKKSSVRKVMAASIFFILSVVYWTLYFQMFICLLLFVDYSVKQYLLNASQMLSVVSLTILIFAIIMGKFWMYLARKGRMTNDIDKFNVAFVLIALAFILIEVFVYETPGAIKVSPFAFIIGYFIVGISELCISAIGLSLVTKVAPKGFVALYMGVWLITLGIGGKLAGILSSYFYIPKTDVLLAKANIADALDIFVLIAVSAFLAILVLRKFVNKYTH